MEMHRQEKTERGGGKTRRQEKKGVERMMNEERDGVRDIEYKEREEGKKRGGRKA